MKGAILVKKNWTREARTFSKNEGGDRGGSRSRLGKEEVYL